MTPGWPNRTQATLVGGERSQHRAIPSFYTKYLPCGIVGNEVAAGVDGLTSKRYKRDAEIKNNRSLFA